MNTSSSTPTSQTYRPHLTHFTCSADAPRGTVLIAHGFAEHQGRHTYFARALNKAGWDAITYDHRGHGTSPGRRASVDVEQLVKDHIHARFLAQSMKRPASGDRDDLVLFGHSMGGLISARSAEIEPGRVRALVLTGPAFAPLPPVPLKVVNLLKPLTRFVPNLTTVKIKGDEVCHDPEVVASYDTDPLNYRGRVPLLTSVTMILEGEKAASEGRKVTAPTYVLHGGDDTLADVEGSRRFVTNVSNAGHKATLEVLDGLYHEVLQEPNKEDSIEKIVRFLNLH